MFAFTTLVVTLLLLLYFLPTVIAAAKRHRNVVAIWVVNLCFGWSGFGYFGALIWALSNPTPVAWAVVDGKAVAVDGRRRTGTNPAWILVLLMLVVAALTAFVAGPALQEATGHTGVSEHPVASTTKQAPVVTLPPVQSDPTTAGDIETEAKGYEEAPASEIHVPAPEAQQ